MIRHYLSNNNETCCSHFHPTFRGLGNWIRAAAAAPGHCTGGCLSLAARAWRSDGFLAMYLKEQVEPTHEGVDAPIVGASFLLSETFERRAI